MNAPPDRRSAPAFLIGCHRSGTTLARYLIDAHPEIACPPETKFIAALHDLLGAPQVLPGLLSLKLRPAEILVEMGFFAGRLLDLSAVRNGKRRWVDKTPNYYRILPFIDDIFQHRALYLILVRHPLDTVASLQEHFWYATARHEDPEIARVVERHGVGLQAWAHYWREAAEATDVFAASHADRALVFKYEDLVAAPGATAAGLFAFLGEDAPNGLPATAFGRARDPGYEDPKAASQTAIHDRSVGRWRSWPRAQVDALWPIVAERAARLGYRIEPVQPGGGGP